MSGTCSLGACAHRFSWKLVVDDHSLPLTPSFLCPPSELRSSHVSCLLDQPLCGFKDEGGREGQRFQRWRWQPDDEPTGSVRMPETCRLCRGGGYHEIYLVTRLTPLSLPLLYGMDEHLVV